MFRTALLILSGNAFGSLMLLIRNLAVARLVSVEDYGIAATFAISMAVTEMMTGLGLQQLIVQDKQGDDPDLQAGLQGVNVLRGLFSGATLFLLAEPIANFLGIPDVAWAYQLLALIPVLRSFEHFDIYRLNRKMQFRPLILTKAVPALLSVLSLWPLYHAFNDYRVMLYSVLLQWLLTTLASHIVAKRPYQLHLARTVTLQALRFGWPILINNIFLFAVFQGDKLIVGREFGMATLAIFSMGITLTLTPTLVSAASESNFFLPQLSTAADGTEFRGLAYAAMQTSLVSGGALVTLIVFVAHPLISLLLGEKYAELIAILTLFAIWMAMRSFKIGGTVVALSKAQTSNAMFANGVRILALPLAWIVAVNGGSLVQIIWIATLGEFAAYLVSLILVKRQLQLPLKPLALPFVSAGVLLTLAAVEPSLFLLMGHTMYLKQVAVFAAFVVLLVSAKDLRHYIVRKKLV